MTKNTKVQEEKTVDSKENLPTEKEKRGQTRKSLKKYYFPEINKSIEADSMEEATKKARSVK